MQQREQKTTAEQPLDHVTCKIFYFSFTFSSFFKKQKSYVSKKEVGLDGQSKGSDYKVKCDDCDQQFDIPSDAELGEIFSCPGCGVEYEVKGKTKDSIDIDYCTMEGEDWGE